VDQKAPSVGRVIGAIPALQELKFKEVAALGCARLPWGVSNSGDAVQSVSDEVGNHVTFALFLLPPSHMPGGLMDEIHSAGASRAA
jgi:hypothetical protein